MKNITRMIRKCYSVLIYLMACLFLCSCASQATLTGGDKDITPPKIIKYYPPNHSVNFKEKQLKFTFDEYIQLASPTDNILISPSLSHTPEYILKGKSLVVKFKNELQAQTTYTLSFLEAIKDITEGNVIITEQFVFSTGNTEDSLVIAGCLIDAFTSEPCAKIGVMLYENLNDSAPLKDVPDYFTYTDSKGNFSFNNLPQKTFLLFALEDKNFNKIYDLPDERIAFADDYIKAYEILKIQTDTTLLIDKDKMDSLALTLSLFQFHDTILKFLRKTQIKEANLQFVFNNEIEKFNITPLDTNIEDLYLWDFGRKKDTVELFFNHLIDKEILFQVEANGRIFDTLDINPAAKTSGGKLRRKSQDSLPEKKILNYSVANAGELNRKLTLIFDYPLKEADFAALLLLELKKEKKIDSLLNINGEDSIVEINLYDTLIPVVSFEDSMHRKLIIDYPWKNKKSYLLFCRDSVFVSHFNHYNDTIRLDFKTKSTKDYGTLTINYEFEDTNTYLTQLLNEKKEVLLQDSITSNKIISYEFLHPEKYYLRVIFDDNHNGRWDTGNYAGKKQAEKVIYFNKTIDVKANWTIEETFSVK